MKSKEEKKVEARERQGKYDELSLDEKLAKAKKLGGENSKEYKKLLKKKG